MSPSHPLALVTAAEITAATSAVRQSFGAGKDPKALRWIPKASFIRWASEGLAVNEFTGLTFSCAGTRGPCCETGEQALERVSFQSSSVRKAAVAQAKLIGGLYLATLYVLQRSAPKFMSVSAPAVA